MNASRPVVLAIAIAAILTVIVAAAYADDYYVDQSATGSGSGGDWTNAFTTIEDGIKACSGTSADTVHVAAATYAENLVLDNYVTLLGGYPPGGGTRDPDTNVTIIDGKGTGIAVHIENKIEVEIDGFTIQNGYRAGTGGGVRIYNDASAKITNCVVQDSNATTNGGGIYVYYDCVVEISDCDILNNKAREGAGIYVYDAEVSISGCRISHNDAVNVGSVSRLGGGIRCGYWSDVTIDECEISYNTADYDGGGIYADHVDSLVVTDCNIFGNRAKHWGGGFYGAYYDFELRDCVIRDNLADSAEYDGYGGGLSFYEGVVDRCKVIDCIVRSNKAEDGGGGVYCSDSAPSFENTVISDNEVTNGNGGGFWNEFDSAPTLMNCIVVDNRADYGGGIYNAYNSGHPASVTVHSCTFSENEAYLTDSGGAIFLEDDASAEVRDSILWRDRPNETDGTGTFTITYSDVDGSGFGEDGGCTPDTNGNIDCRPEFIASYYLRQKDAGQSVDSPCLDTGSDTAANLGLDDRTTRTDGKFDSDQVDMGFHHPEAATLHHYVDVTNGDDSNFGTGWDDAFATIQRAIDECELGTSSDLDVIHVAEGTYVENIELDSYITMLGGYPAGGGTRDPHTYHSIIDGNYIKNTVLIEGASASSRMQCVTIDGFTVTGGHANGDFPYLDGGGICAHWADYVSVIDCILEDNDTQGNGRGGGMQFFECNNGALSDVSIVGNTCSWNGGGLCCIYSYDLEIISCDISGNNSTAGGAYFSACSGVMDHCTVHGNASTGTYCGGLGFQSGANLTVTNCLVTGNEAGQYGAGVYCGYSSSPTLINLTVADNSCATDGGGLYCSDSNDQPTLRNCIFWDDAPNEFGGVLTNVTVSHCDAEGSGYGEDGGCTPDTNGNMDCDPLFVSGYYLSETSAGQESDSPCINRGDDTAENLDLDDRTTRTDGVDDTGMVDMGYHYLDGSILHHYVDEWSGDDSNGGTSWSDAFLTIQAAIDACTDGTCENPDVIHVAKGIYIENLVLDSNITLLGGYFTGGQYTRDPDRYITIIDGDAADVVVTIDKKDCVTINGFTIQNGSSATGGGFYIYDCDPVLQRCIIRANTTTGDGGGLRCYYCSPTITDCQIDDNAASSEGGGVYCFMSSPQLKGCTITHNSSTSSGGGIYTYWGSPEMTNCLMMGNESGDDGGGAYFQYSCSPVLTNCLITGNKAVRNAGGVCATHDGGNPELVNCTIADNEADSNDDSIGEGGGLYIAHSTSHPTVLNSILWDNNPESLAGDRSGLTITYSDVEDSGYGEDGGCTPDSDGNMDCDPKFATGYYLSQTAAGQSTNSPCVDAGSGTAASRGLDDRTTRTDGEYDAGPVDMGFHYIGMCDYYVETTGSDTTGDGTSANPWQTVAHALRWIAGNDPGCAAEPNTIHIAAGTYDSSTGESYPLRMQNYVSLSGEHPDTTILDAEASGRVISSMMQNNFTIENLTITGGYASGESGSPSDGAGIDCYESSPELLNCRITGNTAVSDGGGICCYGSSLSLTNCIVDGNTAQDNRGGGFHCSISTPRLMNCLFFGNTAVFGGGIGCYASSPELINCTLADNEASSGGGIYCQHPASAPDLVNCILWGDSPEELDGETSGITVTYSDVQGSDYGEDGGCTPDSDGNMDCDPLFIAGYYLSQKTTGQSTDSPCLDAGSDTAANLGLDDRTTRTDGYPDEGPVDMGYHYEAGISVFYVDATNGDDDNGGTSWGDAFATIKKAIDMCSGGSCEDPNVIHVAEGAYVENLVMESYITMLGGYPAGGGTRNPILYVTVIDGDAAGSVITIDTKECVTIDGFTIQNGSADDGGGIYCSESSPIISNNKITGNTAAVYGNGSGIYCRVQSSPTIIDCEITGNTESILGGGIFCFSESSPEISNCMIDGNESGVGGGIYCWGYCSPVVTNCLISNNEASMGAGIYSRMDSSPTFTDCEITGNAARNYGGGIASYSGTAPELFNCLLSGNTAVNYGGAVCCEENSPTLTNCTIADNEAGDTGGGIYCYDSDCAPELLNCILWGDTPNEIAGDTTNVAVTYSDVEGSDYGEDGGCTPDSNGNMDCDPLFVPIYDAPYYLAHVGAQAANSPCIDRGDQPASAYGLDAYTTCTDGTPDGGVVDMGYHYRDGYHGNDDTWIRLTSFEARVYGSSVVLTWETGAEIRNAGFVIYRAIAGTHDYQQISGLIAAEGGPTMGASYSFIDTKANQGVTYSYWLVDIDSSGEWTAHGPVSATVPTHSMPIELPTANYQLPTAR